MPAFTGRREPYTAIGIRRLTCATEGCSNRAHAQWNACANGGRFVPICKDCDLKLNRMALEFLGLPNTDELMASYQGAGQ